MRMSGSAVMDSQKSKQFHEDEVDPGRFDNRNTLVSKLYTINIFSIHSPQDNFLVSVVRVSFELDG